MATKQEAPEILENHGDLIRFKCRCGTEVSMVPERQVETQECHNCGAVIWLETRIACGFLDTLKPIQNADHRRVFDAVATGKHLTGAFIP